MSLRKWKCFQIIFQASVWMKSLCVCILFLNACILLSVLLQRSGLFCILKSLSGGLEQNKTARIPALVFIPTQQGGNFLRVQVLFRDSFFCFVFFLPLIRPDFGISPASSPSRFRLRATFETIVFIWTHLKQVRGVTPAKYQTITSMGKKRQIPPSQLEFGGIFFQNN